MLVIGLSEHKIINGLVKQNYYAVNLNLEKN